MKREALDRLLSDDSIEPSSGFAARVMGALHEAAAAPPPLPFPWGRLALGVVACLMLSGAATLLAPQAAATWTELADRIVPAATLASVAVQLGRATAGLAFALALSRLPRLFVRS